MKNSKEKVKQVVIKTGHTDLVSSLHTSNNPSGSSYDKGRKHLNEN